MTSRFGMAMVLVSLAALTACEGDQGTLVGIDTEIEAVRTSTATAAAVTGSGHYTRPNGAWRTFSFQVREMRDGTTRGRFHLVGHERPQLKLHGRLTCVSVVGDEAWIGGIYERASNPGMVGMGFGFYVKDGGEGRWASPDLLHRHVRGQDPETWCAEMRDLSASEFLYPVEAGNIVIHDR